MLRRLWSLLVVATVLGSLSAIETVYSYQDHSYVVRAEDGRIKGMSNREDKDFVLGGLLPIHLADNSLGCGEILHGGLEDMEGITYSIDRINSDPELLANLTLGFDIRDTCYSEKVGLEEALELVIQTNNLLDSITCMNTGGVVPTLGIVGARASRVTVPVAGLTRLFEMPQVSHFSTSAILNDRSSYEYFHRTIPHDNLQAQAMVDLMLRFNWTYISIVFSRDQYSQPGRDELHRLADENGICVAVDEGIDNDFTDEDYRSVVTKLVNSTANVVVHFGNQQHAVMLLNQLTNVGLLKNIVWIASDAWSLIGNLEFPQFNEILAGQYGIVAPTRFNKEFNEYFSELTIESNKRNPWYPEYYAATVMCNLEQGSNNSCKTNGSITQLPNYEQSNDVPLVIDAVYTFANALHNFLMENCDHPVEWNRTNYTCKGQKGELNGINLLTYIENVDFVSPTGTRIVFDEFGSVEGNYDIVNYQVTDHGGERQYSYLPVGNWNSSVTNGTRLALNANESLQFGLNDVAEIIDEPLTSQCGQCEPGQYGSKRSSSCCDIVCLPCLGQNYSTESLTSSCESCSEYGEMWGNNPTVGSDACIPIEETFANFTDPGSIIILIVTILGLIAVTTTALIFGIHWKTPLLKSSGREQMVILMIGIGLSYVMGFIYAAPPSIGTCILQRTGPWLCFSLMFGALMIKVIRVARIFLGNTKLTRPRFIEPKYQIFFTSLIVSGQLVLVISSLVYKYPETLRTLRHNSDTPNHFPTIEITCVMDSFVFWLLSVAYETTLVIISTILGVMSFKYPANFNEARYISFCTFAILIIWIAFIPSYFATETEVEIQNAVISLAVEMNAFVVLGCIFGPKLYVVLFHRDQNSAEFSSHKIKKVPNLDNPSNPNSTSTRGIKLDTLETGEMTLNENIANGERLIRIKLMHLKANGTHTT